MLDLESGVNLLLSVFKDGRTASDMASFIGVSTKKVNQYLAENPDKFQKNNSRVPSWTLKVESDSVMLKLQNRDGAKVFSQEDFDNLADWEHGAAFVGRYDYTTNSGNVIECDSKSELLLLEYLEDHNLVKDIGGQMLKIKYESAFRKGLNYYPDIVAYTWDNHIAIFEVKPVSAMDYHQNLEKYQALAEFCEEHGFMYVMIDPEEDFATYEEIRDMNVCTELLEMFTTWNSKPDTKRKPYKKFTDEDVKTWYDEFGDGYTKKEFYLEVHSLIMYYGWYNLFKHGFMVYSCPVKLNKAHKVVEYRQ